MTSTVLNKEDLKNIYTLYLDKNMSRRDISKKYRIPEHVISDILKAGSYAGFHSKN